MAKGSQLKQLKTALHQAGFAGQPQAGKKRKRAAPTERDKEKKAAKPVVLGPYRFTHAQLEKEGIIVESNVPDNRCVPCFF